MKSKTSLWCLGGLLVCLAALVFWSFSGSRPGKQVKQADGTKSAVVASGSHGMEDPSSRRPRRGSRGARQEAAVTSSPEVDRLLADTTISDKDLVGKLRELALDKSLLAEHRLEALTHGLNLDVTAFSGLSADPELPADMASLLLSEFINYNQSQAMQIEVYMNLVYHSDPDVSAQAREMLAFRVDDDAGELDTPSLLRAGAKKLQELKQNPEEPP